MAEGLYGSDPHFLTAGAVSRGGGITPGITPGLTPTPPPAFGGSLPSYLSLREGSSDRLRLYRDKTAVKLKFKQVVDVATREAVRRSPLGLDLYLWLTYRTFALDRPLRLTWSQLYRQFGADPARANDARTVDAFRTDCLRELGKIQRAWPNLNCRTVKGRLVIEPSHPRIAPAQLSLRE